MALSATAHGAYFVTPEVSTDTHQQQYPLLVQRAAAVTTA